MHGFVRMCSKHFCPAASLLSQKLLFADLRIRMQTLVSSAIRLPQNDSMKSYSADPQVASTLHDCQVSTQGLLDNCLELQGALAEQNPAVPSLPAFAKSEVASFLSSFPSPTFTFLFSCFFLLGSRTFL